MAMPAHEIEGLVRQAFPDALLTIDDLVGDGDHFALRVISASFEGKNRVKRHQMVYQALGACVGRELHALSLTTLTPLEVSLVD